MKEVLRMEANPFRSNFQTSPLAEKVLREGKIIHTNETPQMMIERMTNALFMIENRFGTPHTEIERLTNEFGAFLDGKYCVMSTPVMTNAGYYTYKPLSACTIPPVDLQTNFRQVKQTIDDFHQKGMGTGFNLNNTENPIQILKFLNDVAVEGANSGREDRPVGNISNSQYSSS